mgnify:CR=1 FL=1
MLYYIFKYLDEAYNLPGAGLFQYITFRSGIAVILSLLISTIYGKRIINYLRNKQVGETVRELGLDGQVQKAGTPTMGGIIILLSILIPTLLFANLDKVYIRLMILCTVWLGLIGFLDDYFKIRARKEAQSKGEAYKKQNSDGLAGLSKIIGQVGLGIIIGATLYFSNAVTVEREIISTNISASLQKGEHIAKGADIVVRNINGQERRFVKVKTPITTIPFVKNHEFNYSKLISWISPGAEQYTWIVDRKSVV